MFTTETMIQQAIDKERLDEALRVWNGTAWPVIRVAFENTRARGYSAGVRDIRYKACSIAGRIMVTLERGRYWITVVGSTDAGSECGLHAVRCKTVAEAAGLLRDAGRAYYPAALQVNDKLSIGVDD
jgi:hypothetical protein